MKALSIRQPWAWLIANGFKDIENRSWKTEFRGEFLIHAAKGMTRAEYEDCLDLCQKIKQTNNSLYLPSFDMLERGGIVGQAEIVDCVTDHDSLWFSGKYGFLIRNAIPWNLMACNGRLGFFEPDHNPCIKQTFTF